MAIFSASWLKKPTKKTPKTPAKTSQSSSEPWLKQPTTKKPTSKPKTPTKTSSSSNAPWLKQPVTKKPKISVSKAKTPTKTASSSSEPWLKQPVTKTQNSTSLFGYGNQSNKGLVSTPKATTYTDARAPYLQFANKAAADAYFNNQAQAKAANDARLAAESKATKDRLAREAAEKDDGFRFFDFDGSDGSGSLWEDDRGFWNNVGNLATNALGGLAGGVGGFMVGGPLGAALGAGGGWSGANQLYDWGEGKITGTKEGNALIDYSTLGAALAGGGGGYLWNTLGGAGAAGAAGGAGGAGAAGVASGAGAAGGAGGAGGAIGGAGGSIGLGALADQVLASGNDGSGGGLLGNAWDFFTQNPLGQAATGAGATYLADQLFNQGQGTSAIMDFFTGSGSSPGSGNQIAYGTDLTPQYIVDAQKEALNRARALTDSYKDYEGPLTAGAAQNELLAANVAADAVGGTADALNDARDMTTGADARYERREGPSSYGSGDDFFDQASLSGYMNPYLEFVQQDTLDNISRENEAIQAALGDQMIQVGAFGGSRTGVAEAENNRNMRQQMLQYINQSNAEAFENARDQFNRDEDRRFAYSEADRNQFNTDLGRRLNVGQALGSLANMESALTQQEINNLMSTGGVLRGIEQAGYTNDFNAYQDFWDRMLRLNAAESAVTAGLKSNVLKPPAPEEDPDRLGQVLGALTAGAGLWNTLAGRPKNG